MSVPLMNERRVRAINNEPISADPNAAFLGVADRVYHPVPYVQCYEIWLKAPEDIVVKALIDPRNGGLETLRKLEKMLGKLPPTLTVQSGGGVFQISGEA